MVVGGGVVVVKSTAVVASKIVVEVGRVMSPVMPMVGPVVGPEKVSPTEVTVVVPDVGGRGIKSVVVPLVARVPLEVISVEDAVLTEVTEVVGGAVVRAKQRWVCTLGVGVGGVVIVVIVLDVLVVDVDVDVADEVVLKFGGVGPLPVVTVFIVVVGGLAVPPFLLAG